MANRDEIAVLGYNSRLDTLQAVVGNWLLPQTESIAAKRIEHAAYYDRHLCEIPGIRIPPRVEGMRRVYHLYIVFAERRDELLAHCLAHGIEALENLDRFRAVVGAACGDGLVVLHSRVHCQGA